MEQNLSDKALNRLADGREYRSMTLHAADSTDEEQYIVEGYATTFNQPYVLVDTPDYKVIEVVHPLAFEGADLSDVIMQFDHMGRVFARNRNDTLYFRPDNIGFKIRAMLGGTDNGRQLHQEIKGGYIDRMSYGYTVAEEKCERLVDNTTGKVTITRTILKIKKVYDVSAVSIPANDMTSISARRYADGVIDGIKAERLERARKQKKLKLLLEV